VLQEVTGLWLGDSLGPLASTSDLNSIDLISHFFALDLGYLAPVNLNNSTSSMLAPTIPEVGHSYLEAQQTNTLAFSINWFSWLDIKQTIDLVLISLVV
jgi:hypothetical protein